MLYLCVTAVATQQKTLVTNCVPHPVPVGVGCQLIIGLLKAADMFLFVCFFKTTEIQLRPVFKTLTAFLYQPEGELFSSIFRTVENIGVTNNLQ